MATRDTFASLVSANVQECIFLIISLDIPWAIPIYVKFQIKIKNRLDVTQAFTHSGTDIFVFSSSSFFHSFEPFLF